MNVNERHVCSFFNFVLVICGLGSSVTANRLRRCDGIRASKYGKKQKKAAKAAPYGHPTAGTADIHVKIGHRVKSKPRMPNLSLG
jgi:hypothetical protein